jgi:cephalosporin hydroxylase
MYRLARRFVGRALRRAGILVEKHAPPPQGDPLLAGVAALMDSGRTVEALKAAEVLAAGEPVPLGVHFLRGLCLERIGRHQEAVSAYDEELSRNPAHARARAGRDQLSAALRGDRRPVDPASRPWNSSLPHDVLTMFQAGLHNYTYRGVPMLKSPLDVALYPLLLWRLKPRTVIEIGSKNGGSGLWLADQLETFGIEGHVYSVDVVRVQDVSHPRLSFMEGDGRALEGCFDPGFLAELPRPWLVIEDADHECETSLAVLRFFHPLLKAGEYIVIEDGIISDLAQDASYNSGPHRAIKAFLAEHPRAYEPDAAYCDLFGYNATWCTNGFLRKVDHEVEDIGPSRQPS